MKQRRQIDEKIAKDAAEEILQDNLMNPVLPGLHKFPFAGGTTVLDVYNIFKVEHMYQFHLGISKMLENCSLKNQ